MRTDEHIALTTKTSTYLLDALRDPQNHSAWLRFDERYRPLVVHYACRLGLRPEDAEDAAQQTLLAFNTAYQRGQYDRAKGRLRHWLFGIAHNEIHSVLRRLPNREKQIVDQGDCDSFFDALRDEDQLERIWEEEWRRAVLQECLAHARRTFEPRTLAAFELYAWKGWPAPRVAEHLGISENAVFLAKHKILKSIRQLLPMMEEAW